MSQYTEDVKKMQWSYTRLSSFLHCKYGFYLNYIVKDDDAYPNEGNFWSDAGTYFHDILAQIFTGKLSPDDAPQYFIDHYSDNVFYTTYPRTMEKSYESCATYLSIVDFSKLKDYDIQGVEIPVNFQESGYNFIGYIDLLLQQKQTGDIILVDHKSGEYPLRQNGEPKERQKEIYDGYKKQMYLYSRAIREKYGKYPKTIAWNHYRDGKVNAIPWNEKEYADTMTWFIDTIHAIENETEYAPRDNCWFCQNLCNFRNSCEYHLEANEETEEA